jgi:hypothetical protein
MTAPGLLLRPLRHIGLSPVKANGPSGMAVPEIPRHFRANAAQESDTCPSIVANLKADQEHNQVRHRCAERCAICDSRCCHDDKGESHRGNQSGHREALANDDPDERCCKGKWHHGRNVLPLDANIRPRL